MKRIIFCLITVATLLGMLVPATSSPAVLAASSKASVDFTQYANTDDEWIGSILQKTNSMYYEGMSVPQRTILDGIGLTPGATHSLTFSAMATKGGTHAYDWLTAYNQGNVPPLAYDVCGEKLGNSPDFAAICSDLHTSGYSILVNVPDDPFISKDGSTQSRIDAYEAQFGNRQIEIYGNEPITSASLTLSHDVSDSGDTGDSFIDYVLSWTSNSTQVIVEMAGHLAMSGDPATNLMAWGPNLGASQISGGPYHFKLDKLDGSSLGSQDNQIKGADILPLMGRIVAHKFDDLNANGTQDTGEASLQGWNMTLYDGPDCTGDLLAYSTTGSDGNVVFSDLAAGTYSVRETLQAGWTNTTELCQQATINYGETATLDFGNREFKPDIDVTKTASPTSGAISTNVTFTITVTNTGELPLDPVRVVDTIPDGMTYISAGTSPAPDSAIHNGDGTWTVTWNNITSLAPSNSTTIYLMAQINGDVLGTLTNSVTATGTPPFGTDVEDTDTANVRVYHAGIDVQKTADTTFGVASTDVTFTITVTNTNGSELDPVKVVDVLPDGMTYVSAGTSPAPNSTTLHANGTCTITWDNVGPLASGNSTTIYLVAQINGDVLGTLTNEVTATGTPPEGAKVEDSDTADVTVIDARISISPPEDIDVVGDEHILTANVDFNDGSGWAPYEGATVTFEVISGPGNLDPQSAVTNSTGQATTILTTTSAGTSIVKASTSVYGYDISTDGEAYNSERAQKDWVYARIKIDPQKDTDVVGDLHELTATVETSTNGTDWLPYEDATVTFNVTSGPGSLDPVTDVTDANGEATTTLTSTLAGTSIVEASTSVYGYDISTDGEAYNSGPAQKDWVYARIRITPSEATNVVGDLHELTATVETSTNGTYWLSYEGATVTFEITSGPGDLDPLSAVTNSTGQATTILTSTLAGTSIVEASTSVYGYDISTDGKVYNSGPADKDWVYARITITPSEATNVVGDLHELTATVETSTNGVTWNPYEGANVTFEVTSGPGNLDPEIAVTNSTGQATTTLTSALAGTSVVKASTSVYGYDISTNGEAYNSDPAEKHWVYARIKIDPQKDTDVVGDLHELTATVETSTNGTDWLPYEDATVTFNVTSGPGTLDPESSVTNSTGQATTILTSTLAGTSVVKASTSVYGYDISTDGEASSSGPAQKDWVYARIKITPPEATNVVGDLHQFTASVETSTNGTYWLPYERATVTFEVTSGPGTLDPLSAVTNSTGQAITILTSTETGTTIVAASTSVYGYDISTDGGAYSSYPAEKDWVDARISIVESATNLVGQSHGFTLTVEQNLGAGWVPAAGVNVTPTSSGVGSITSSGPYVTDGSGQVIVTVNSNVVGTAIVDASATVNVGGIDIAVATDGYGAYTVSNRKTWVGPPPPPAGAAGCPTTRHLTVDWEGNNTTKSLYSNDKLAVDLLGPSPDLTSNLFLERATHAPVVDGTTYYLITIRRLDQYPTLPANMQAIAVYNVTPTGAVFDKDLLLTLGLTDAQLPATGNVTMDYYDDINHVWVPLNFEAGGGNGVAALTLSAPVTHFSIYGVLAQVSTTPTQPAHFVASGLNIEQSVQKIWAPVTFVTNTGKTTTITANVFNDGYQQGTFTATLKLNGQTVDTKTVTLGAGQSTQVKFVKSGLGYGHYDVQVAGLSDEFTTSRAITWWLIAVIVVGLGLIIWGIVWGRRRRRAHQTQ
jgi:uncharacterized repeat protein (TIGR01451 family)